MTSDERKAEIERLATRSGNSLWWYTFMSLKLKGTSEQLSMDP